jgi:hypothetical protein
MCRGKQSVTTQPALASPGTAAQAPKRGINWTSVWISGLIGGLAAALFGIIFRALKRQT